MDIKSLNDIPFKSMYKGVENSQESAPDTQVGQPEEASSEDMMKAMHLESLGNQVYVQMLQNKFSL